MSIGPLKPLDVCQAACAQMMEKFGLPSTCIAGFDVFRDRVMFRLLVSATISVHFALQQHEMEQTMWWVMDQIFPSLQEAAFKFWASDEPGEPIPKLPLGHGFEARAEMRA